MEPGFEKKVFKAAVVNVDELVKAQARDVGDAHMTESKEDRSGTRLERFAKRIWKHNLAQEWYRQREISRAKKAILETDDLYVGEKSFDSDKPKKSEARVASDEAMQAIVERFTSEYEDEMLREEERDSKGKLEDEPTLRIIKDLIKAYAGGKIDETAFEEKKKRALSMYDEDYASKKSKYADNLLSIAKNVKDSVDNGVKLSDLDFDIEVTFGKAQESLHTKANHSDFDKKFEWFQNSKIGKHVANEPVAVGIAAGLYEVTRHAIQKGARGLGMGTFIGGSLASGTISAMKERTRVTRERAQHQRELAKGMSFNEKGMKRREEIDQTSYNTREATMIIQNLTDDLERVKSGQFSEDQIKEILGNLADLEARIRLNDQENIDLITYEKFSKVERDRTTMDLRRAELKVELRKINPDFDDELQQFTNTQANNLMWEKGGIDEKDEKFRKLRNTRVRNAFIKSALTTATIGTVVQEIKAGVDGLWGGTQDGIVEGMFKDKENLNSHGSMLEALRRYVTGDHAMVPRGEVHEELLDGGHTKIQLPEGVAFTEPNADGTYNLVKDGELLIDHIPVKFDEYGNFDEGTAEFLKEHGVVSSFANVEERITESVKQHTSDYVQHAEGMHTIHRELWYDNNTPHPFDKNEIKTDWGGVHGTGIDEDGNYVFNIARMTQQGSFHGENNVDAGDAIAAGNLKMLFSFSEDTQHKVFEVEFDGDGNAIIEHDSELGKLMFENHDGHAVFTGKFAEVAESRGLATDGGENVRILSTHVGPGKEMIDGTLTTEDAKPYITLDIPDQNTFSAPPPIPITSRRPLERGQYKSNKKAKTDSRQKSSQKEPVSSEMSQDEPEISQESLRAPEDEVRYNPTQNIFEGQEHTVEKNTKHVYAFSGSWLKEVESKLRTNKYINPAVVILEDDIASRDNALRAFEFLKKKYKDVKFTYVPLPIGIPKFKDQAETDLYLENRLDRVLAKSNLKKDVTHEFKFGKKITPIKKVPF